MKSEPQIHNSRNQKSKLISGGIAQLVERLPCTQEVSGSSPLTSTLTSLNQNRESETQKSAPRPVCTLVRMLESRLQKEP